MRFIPYGPASTTGDMMGYGLGGQLDTVEKRSRASLHRLQICLKIGVIVGYSQLAADTFSLVADR